MSTMESAGGTVLDGEVVDPILNTNFLVYTDNRPFLLFGQVGFDHVAGLGLGETESIPYRPGNSRVTRQILGNTTFRPVTLSKGVDKSRSLIGWRLRVLEMNKKRAGTRENSGGPRPANGVRANVIIAIFDRVLDERHIEHALSAGWPGTLHYTDLQGGSNAAVLMEEAIIHYEVPEVSIADARTGGPRPVEAANG